MKSGRIYKTLNFGVDEQSSSIKDSTKAKLISKMYRGGYRSYREKNLFSIYTGKELYLW